jgi:hypothetical protein
MSGEKKPIRPADVSQMFGLLFAGAAAVATGIWPVMGGLPGIIGRFAAAHALTWNLPPSLIGWAVYLAVPAIVGGIVGLKFGDAWEIDAAIAGERLAEKRQAKIDARRKKKEKPGGEPPPDMTQLY